MGKLMLGQAYRKSKRNPAETFVLEALKIKAYTAYELAALSHKTPAYLLKICKLLEDEGLIAKAGVKGDKRKKIYKLVKNNA